MAPEAGEPVSSALCAPASLPSEGHGDPCSGEGEWLQQRRGRAGRKGAKNHPNERPRAEGGADSYPSRPDKGGYRHVLPPRGAQRQNAFGQSVVPSRSGRDLAASKRGGAPANHAPANGRQALLRSEAGATQRGATGRHRRAEDVHRSAGASALSSPFTVSSPASAHTPKARRQTSSRSFPGTRGGPPGTTPPDTNHDEGLGKGGESATERRPPSFSGWDRGAETVSSTEASPGEAARRSGAQLSASGAFSAVSCAGQKKFCQQTPIQVDSPSQASNFVHCSSVWGKGDHRPAGSPASGAAGELSCSASREGDSRTGSRRQGQPGGDSTNSWAQRLASSNAKLKPAHAASELAGHGCDGRPARSLGGDAEAGERGAPGGRTQTPADREETSARRRGAAAPAEGAGNRRRGSAPPGGPGAPGSPAASAASSSACCAETHHEGRPSASEKSRGSRVALAWGDTDPLVGGDKVETESSSSSRQPGERPLHAVHAASEDVLPHVSSSSSRSEADLSKSHAGGEAGQAKPRAEQGSEGDVGSGGREKDKREEKEAGAPTRDEGAESENEEGVGRSPDGHCLISAVIDRVAALKERTAQRWDEDSQPFPELSLELVATAFPSFVQRGLLNLHNNCYMNAVIQALLPVLLPLWKPLLSSLSAAGEVETAQEGVAPLPFWRSLSRAVRVFLDSRGSSAYAAGDIGGIFQNIICGGGGGGLVWGQQADASEFLLLLFNGLHDECKWMQSLGKSGDLSRSCGAQDDGDDGFVEVGKNNKEIKARVVGSEEDSLLYRLFGGRLRECSVDPRTGSKLSERKEFFLFLSCTVLPHLRTLEAVLDAHFADQEVEPADGTGASGSDGGAGRGRRKGKDGEQGGLKKGTRPKHRLQTQIEVPPPVLVIILQRFCFDRKRQRASKVSHPVGFAETLVLRPSWCVCSPENLRKTASGQLPTAKEAALCFSAGGGADCARGAQDEGKGVAADASEPEASEREEGHQSLLSLEQRTYDLVGVVSHKGLLMNAGHYTAASRLPSSLCTPLLERRGSAPCRSAGKANVPSVWKGDNAWTAAKVGDWPSNETKKEEAHLERTRGANNLEAEKERKIQEGTSWVLSDDTSCQLRSFGAVQDMEGHYVLIFVNRSWKVSADPACSFERARRFEPPSERCKERV
ncbi:ubiquitin carboxyl-terminal hydrolase [Besnoitia besnoiti]|uniref:ubiquitinyl hydrolase 1 n=1 Tax=Besnoitia besnoiti TaxID=94643 RepID=A0A2A9M5R7_BESBE|nr:ubiquitin carboxyl-terminal hydrolase [Besnoitia besnoiti]PFH33818.1 ubiquitin carboxyl-terminal hydrolase [Besnoitia besnoiti]